MHRTNTYHLLSTAWQFNACTPAVMLHWLLHFSWLYSNLRVSAHINLATTTNGRSMILRKQLHKINSISVSWGFYANTPAVMLHRLWHFCRLAIHLLIVNGFYANQSHIVAIFLFKIQFAEKKLTMAFWVKNFPSPYTALIIWYFQF